MMIFARIQDELSIAKTKGRDIIFIVATRDKSTAEMSNVRVFLPTQ